MSSPFSAKILRTKLGSLTLRLFVALKPHNSRIFHNESLFFYGTTQQSPMKNPRVPRILARFPGILKFQQPQLKEVYKDVQGRIELLCKLCFDLVQSTRKSLKDLNLLFDKFVMLQPIELHLNTIELAENHY
jgi:hypothetical protein